MRLLLDSHVLLWWLDDPWRLAASARLAIADPRNEVFASSASLWELYLKAAKGKLTMPVSLGDCLCQESITELAVTWLHAETGRRLEWDHFDPFDRILVAQCVAESLTLVTRDRLLLDAGLVATLEA